MATKIAVVPLKRKHVKKALVDLAKANSTTDVKNAIKGLGPNSRTETPDADMDDICTSAVANYLQALGQTKAEDNDDDIFPTGEGDDDESLDDFLE